MQDVQTRTRRLVPPAVVRIIWMFGFQRRGVRRCEWETLLPNPGPLPQISQTADTGAPLQNSDDGRCARALRAECSAAAAPSGSAQDNRPAARNANQR